MCDTYGPDCLEEGSMEGPADERYPDDLPGWTIAEAAAYFAQRRAAREGTACPHP